MGISRLVLCLLATACFAFLVIYAVRAIARKGGSTQAFTAAVAFVLFLAMGFALLLPLGRRHVPANDRIRVLDNHHEEILATEWSERSVGEYANYPSFRSAVSGLLGNAVLTARRCGVRGQYVQNLVATNLRTEWLSPAQAEKIKQTVLSRDGSRLILVDNTPSTSLPKQYLGVAFDIQGNQKEGNIQIRIDVKENGASVGGNSALPSTILAEYTNQPWVEEIGSAEQNNASHVIGCSQESPRLEEARNLAMANARLRFIDSALNAIEVSQHKQQAANEIETRAAVESYLGDHPELKQDEFVQQTRGSQKAKYRVAVMMDFPQNSILGALTLPDKAETKSWMKQAIAVIGLAMLLMLSFLFLDVGRRGRYAWPLRIGTAIVFAGLCVLLWKIGPLM